MQTYQTDPQMDIFIGQEPMHSRPLIRKCMRILPRSLRCFFCLRDGRARIVTWDAAGIETGGMGWRSELLGFFEDYRSCCDGGGGEMSRWEASAE